MEWIDHFEEAFNECIHLIEIAFEAIAVFCILAGLVQTIQLGIRLISQPHDAQTPFVLVRIRLGSWLGLALEFQLGADILATTVAPSWESLGKLGAIAVIRTFLNYFLGRELTEQLALREKIIEQTNSGLSPPKS